MIMDHFHCYHTSELMRCLVAGINSWIHNFVFVFMRFARKSLRLQSEKRKWEMVRRRVREGERDRDDVNVDRCDGRWKWLHLVCDSTIIIYSHVKSLYETINSKNVQSDAGMKRKFMSCFFRYPESGLYTFLSYVIHSSTEYANDSTPNNWTFEIEIIDSKATHRDRANNEK